MIVLEGVVNLITLKKKIGIQLPDFNHLNVEDKYSEFKLSDDVVIVIMKKELYEWQKKQV